MQQQNNLIAASDKRFYSIIDLEKGKNQQKYLF